MKRLAVLLVAIACALGLPACVKMGSSTTVNNDASGTVKLSMGVKTEAIENIRAYMDAMAQMAGEEMGEAMEALDELDELFDEEKLAAKLKESGLEIVSSKSTDKEGWKSIEVDAKFANVNVWTEKAKKMAEAEGEKQGAPWGDMPIGDFGSMTPSFYKTSTAGVGQIVLIPALKDAMGGMDLEQLDELGDEELDMIEAQMEDMKSRFSIGEMRMVMSMTLPGDVMETKGCKKTSDRTISFTFAGGDINLDGMKTMFGMKDGVSATFKIPEDCKIAFNEPKTAANAETPPVDEAEPVKKKGGLKIK